MYYRTLTRCIGKGNKSAGASTPHHTPHQTVSEPKTKARFLATVGPVMDEGLMKPQLTLLGRKKLY